MRSKEEYYQLVLQNREIASRAENLRCTCSELLCEWHGKCRECIALHRYHGDHVPACLQPMMQERLEAVARLAERTTTAGERTPREHRLYVRQRDAMAAEETKPQR